jgi:hypothetical protein
MIEVKYELEGDIDDEEAERAVERVLRYHQHVLAGLTCSIHGSPPWLRVRGRVIERLTVTIESCCESLAGLTLARIQHVSRREQD